MPRHARLLLLLSLLLVTACLGYRVSQREFELATGETASVELSEIHYASGDLAIGVVSDDPSIMTVEPDSVAAGGHTFTIRALHAGTANILARQDGWHLVTVHVFECPTVTLDQSPSFVETKPGNAVQLRAQPKGFQFLSMQWYEDRGNGWQPIPFATDPRLTFTPKTSGAYHIQARYHDRCGDVTANFTIIATSRGRAAWH